MSQGSGAGFEAIDFDDSTWSTGAASFGFGCGTTEGTSWPTDTDILLRKHLHVPEGTAGVTVAAVVDNDVQIFLNGVDVSGGLQVHEGCADYSDPFVFSVPREVLRAGDNLLAVRGRDRGTVSFLDIQISGGVLP